MSIISEIFRGVHFDIGNRELYEDRVTSSHIVTAGGLTLDVALVADGVGGENKGERAAQLAVDTTINFIKESEETDIPALLSQAFKAANTAVHGEFHNHEGASCTLSIAVIHDNNRLYIANVGDSRVYLFRNGDLIQLSLDHTFGYIVPIQGKMSVEDARSNPNADIIMRALGPKAKMPVDVGFHHNEDTQTLKDYKAAQELGKEGLELIKGDAIIVCSDGLFQPSPQDGTPVVHLEEFIQVLSSQKEEKAARALVSFALGRDVSDNVSVALLQTSDPAVDHAVALGGNGEAPGTVRSYQSVKDEVQSRNSFSRFLFISFGIFVALILMGVIVSFVILQRRSNEEQELLAQQNTRSAQNLLLEQQRRQTAEAQKDFLEATSAMTTRIYEVDLLTTQTVEAIIAEREQALPTETPIPTRTPRPPLIEDQIGDYYIGLDSDPINLFEDERISSPARLEFQINHTDEDLPFGSIYGFPDSDLEFNRVSTQMEFELYEGSDIFIETGRYEERVEAELSPANVFITIQGQCMAIDYSIEEEKIDAYCFDGTCRYRVGRNQPQLIEQGKKATLFTDDLDKDAEFRNITTVEALRYQRLLIETSSGQEDIEACLIEFIPPTPTPTATPTIVVERPTLEPPTSTPTATRRPSSGSNSSSRPTSTPTPRPTATRRPTATKSPTPRISTSTPVPSTATLPPPPPPEDTPTHTPVPTRTPVPTSTPIPTNTPVPPTDTPIPTNTPVPPTDTPIPTNTAIPPTDTPIPTNTLVPPTETSIPPTATDEPPPTATDEPPPTATDEPPPTATDEPPPTATDEPPPTATDEPPPTETSEPSPGT
ncbi:MAG: protein phosphatase 2C domain-containing protein [Anaerolineae bacterium]